jgi:succinoglycan biosynthesis protein ExoA
VSESADWRADPAWPDVDVVMPILNEAAHLGTALAAVREQDYPGRLRVIMAIGPSTDGTEAVAADLAALDTDLVVVDNPTGKTPAALNFAIRAGTAPVIVRVDGHSQLSGGYIEQAVTTLRRTGAANVGGMQVPVGTTPFEHAVAAATSSWMGTGGASYRTGGVEAAVDTVYLGVFDRAAIEAVGLFDERLIRNQDYELNIRLRKAGSTVVFDPELWVGYTPRGSWKALAKQYFEYGRWKAVVLKMHPESARLRQIVPPLAVGALGIATVLSVRWRAFRLPLAAYGVVSVVAARRSVGRHGGDTCLVSILFPTIHVSWAAGLAAASVTRRWGNLQSQFRRLQRDAPAPADSESTGHLRTLSRS